MAELLLYNKLHWYDELDDKARVEIDKKYPGKFNSRYKKGDIVEVRPDGYFTKHGFNKKAFAVVLMPDVKDVEYLADPQEDGDILVSRRRYQSDTSKLSIDTTATNEVAKLDDAFITDKAVVK